MQKLAKKLVYLQNNALNRSLNTEEKIDLNIKTFNPRNKVYFRNFTSLDYNPFGIPKISNWNEKINKESIGNTIPEKNYFSLSLKNSFSKSTKNPREKVILFNQYTIRDESIHKYTYNNILKKRKTFGRENNNITNPDNQNTNQRKSNNNNIFQKNIKNNSYDTKYIISARSANNFYPEKPNENSIDLVNDSLITKKKNKFDKYIIDKSNKNDINLNSSKKNKFNYKNINYDSLIKQKLINKMNINKNNSNIIDNKENKEFSYLNISDICHDNKSSNIQLYDLNKNKINNQSTNNGHYYNMSLKKYKMHNNNFIINNNNNIFDDSNIKKIKVNINNNLNKSKNKNNKKKNSLNKTISNTNNINDNKNDNIQRILYTNNNKINNRYNLNLRPELQNFNSKRDIIHGEYTNLIRITPRITKCNTPNHNKIFNTKADLQKSIDCNTLSQLDNQNNDIDMNISTEKNKNIYQILYNNKIGKNLLNINRNNEWSNLYYSIDSNNLRNSGNKLDLTLNNNYKNENQPKINDFATKDKIDNFESNNETSINDYSFMKKKNCLGIDYIYKNKHGIKLFKSNDNIYPSNQNTGNNSKHNSKILNYENLDEYRGNYNIKESLRTPKLYITKTDNKIYKSKNNDIKNRITTDPSSIDYDTNENNNNIYKDNNDEYFSIINNNNNENSLGFKLNLLKNDLKYNKNINKYFNQKKISNQYKNPKISLNIDNNNNKNNEINVNRNNNIMKSNTEDCYNIFLNNDTFSKKFIKKNRSININLDEKEKYSNMNEKDVNMNKINRINLKNEENKLKNVNKYKAKISNNQANQGNTQSNLKSNSIKYNDENISNANNKKKKLTKSYKNIHYKNKESNNNNTNNGNNNNVNKQKLVFSNSETYLFNQHNFNNLKEKLNETINNNKNINIYINKSVIDSFKIQPEYNPNLNMINYYNQINIGKPLITAGNSIKLDIKNRTQNQTPKNIYKKPNCRSKPKTNARQKGKMNNNKTKKNNFITTLKKHKGASKSLNLEFNFNIFPPFYLKDKKIKNNLDYMDIDCLDSNKKMSCFSLNVTPKNNIKAINLYDNELPHYEKRKIYKYTNLNNYKVRNPYEINSYSFISKKYNYYLKKTLIENCYIDKSIYNHS